MIFTTGAYMEPMLVNGEYRWVVTGFEDDTFKDGEVFNPPISGKAIEDVEDEESIALHNGGYEKE